MRKMINIRNSVIILLCITVICMAFGFIVISLSLKSEKEKISSFNVVFTKIKKTSSAKGTSVEPIGSGLIDTNKKLLHMTFQLNAPHDELIYVATIKNNGTIPARIVKIMESPNYQTEQMSKLIQPVTIQLSDIENKVLKPKEEIELRIIAFYNPTTTNASVKKIEYDLGLITESINS